VLLVSLLSVLLELLDSVLELLDSVLLELLDSVLLLDDGELALDSSPSVLPDDVELSLDDDELELKLSSSTSASCGIRSRNCCEMASVVPGVSAIAWISPFHPSMDTPSVVPALT
jgi:hypothetical protein